MNQKIWVVLYFIFIILISFHTLKANIGFEIRISQVYLLLLFLFISLYDLKNKNFNIKLYLFFLVSGILMTLISLNSTYEKIGEFKFIIKYVIIFPAAFYIGYRTFYFLKLKDIIRISELAIFMVGGLAVYLYYFPIAFLIHDRGALTGLQGTFWESSGLSIYLSIFFLISFILRLYLNSITPKSISLYLFALTLIILAKTKIVYLAFILIFIIATYYKLDLIKKLSYKEIRYTHAISNFISKINVKKMILILFLFFIILIIYNYIDPFISKEIIKNKIENERGRALKVTLELLEQSNWLGCFGWGFVEKYFTSIYRGEGIIGLGEGVNAIFNSFLDIWISVGIYGVIFQIILLTLAFSKKNFLTVALPTFLFVVGLTGPVFIDFSYYFFLGFSYSFKKFVEVK